MEQWHGCDEWRIQRAEMTELLRIVRLLEDVDDVALAPEQIDVILGVRPFGRE